MHGRPAGSGTDVVSASPRITKQEIMAEESVTVMFRPPPRLQLLLQFTERAIA
jgi:hypothetical protein